MTLFHQNKESEEDPLIAVFDIGSASVGGLLFNHTKKHLPEVLISVRQAVDFSPEAGLSATWRIFHQAFIAVADHLKKTAHQKPAVALCVFSSPWYVSQTKIIKLQRKEPIEIKRVLFEDLIQDEMEVFQRRWSTSIWGEKGKGIFFEHEAVKSVLNGYQVKFPFGKTVKNLELYVYLSLGLDLMEEKIKQDILHDIKPDSIHFHTFPFILFKVLKNIMNTDEGLILLDITGELTDLFLIRNNFIEETNCFAKGENFLVRRLASGLNKDFFESKMLISQYRRGELNVEFAQKISEILKPAGEEWAKDLGRFLKEMAKDKLLPQKFYFCGPAGSLKEISSRVSDREFAKFTIFGRPFDVNFLLPESLKYHFDFSEGFSNNNDIFLLLSTLFADKFCVN